MAAIQSTIMTYIKTSMIDRLTNVYINTKHNPKQPLSKEAQEWRKHMCKPTRENSYGDNLSFTEAYEKYILHELSHKKREDIRLTIERIPAGKPATKHAVEEEPVFTTSDYKQLLERLDQLELEVAMLKSQNAFADVVGK